MMEVKMPNGAVLASDNEEVINSYVKYMEGVLVVPKKERKSATKVASAKEAE